jgi:putative ABC transport system permease protein
MTALHRKLLRDLRLMWSQALTIALVVASGIGGFITSLSAVDSLALARDRFYAQAHFADVFGSVKRAPLALEATLRALPGVADVQTTLEAVVRVALPGIDDPIIGQLIGLEADPPPRLNLVTLAQGRWPVGTGAGADTAAGAPRGDGPIEALVSVGFARARQLAPGATVRALINGRQRTLVIVGTALSPEYVFAGLWGMPDQRGFGVFWLPRDGLAAAYDMRGAFNRLAVKLAPQARQADVIAALTRSLAPWGGSEPVGRDDQVSHAMLDNEIKEQRVLGTVLPAIFLGVAAFLLNVVVSRLVATQREQIATLKALGYADAAIATHYLQWVGLIVVFGLGLGVALGDRLGALFTGLYAEFFHFPRFTHHLPPELVLLSAAITAATAVLGTLNAIIGTVRLAPAEAMQPPAPGRYHRTLLERLGVRRLSPALRMVLRNMERRPLRTGLSIAGVAASVAIVIMGNFFRDAIDVIVDTQFNLAMRSDVSMWMVEPGDARTALALARLPGVTQVEAVRFVPVTLVHGHRRERSLIRSHPPGGELMRLVDIEGRATPLPDDGLVLTDRLADKLGLRVGDTVTVEEMEGRRRSLALTVVATVREMMGLNAYMSRPALNRALGDGDLATGYQLALERGREPELLRALHALPRVAGAFSKATMLHNMQAISARNVRIMSTVMTLFASVIAVGVVYNNARIALAERGWELASLRVLGFTRGEVSALLLGELVLSMAVALPLGMALGWALVHSITGLLKSDQFFFPVVILPRTYAGAAVCVLAAGAASAAVVRRRIDRLDLVAVLKTRE